MAKNYTDELAQWTIRRQGKARERNLVTFHGLQDDVRAGLAAGYSSKTIWAHMHDQGRVDFSYETFLVYVNRVIKTARSAKQSALSGENVLAGAMSSGVTPQVDPSALSRKESLSAQTSDRLVPSAQPDSSAAPQPPTSPISSTPPRRTGMPTFKFNPIPNRENLR